MFEGELMPKVVAHLVSGWRSTAFELHGKWRDAVSDNKPVPELTGPIGEVLTRHLTELADLRRSQFGRSILPAAESAALAALRAQPGKGGLKGDWTLEDDSTRWLLAELTAALDRLLSARSLAEDQRDQLRAALRDEGRRVQDGIDDEPEFAAIVDAQVKLMIAGRIGSRVERTSLRPEDFEGVRQELMQTLGFVCFLELLLIAHPDLFDRWRQEAAADRSAVAAWNNVDGSTSVPPGAADWPGLDTSSRGPHTHRDGLKLARAVLTPRGGRDQSPLPRRLDELHRERGPKSVAHVVVREELWREAFPFALSNPQLGHAAALAWMLLDARQRPVALIDQFRSVCGDSQVEDGWQARALLKRTRRAFQDVGGTGIWDLAVIGAAIQGGSHLSTGADGWNDTLAEEIFGETSLSAFFRRTLAPSDILDRSRPDRRTGSFEPLNPAGTRIRQRLLKLDNGGRPFEPGDGHWSTVADQCDRAADEVFDWWIGQLRRQERDVEPGVELPHQDGTDSQGRWAAGEVNRWLSGPTLAKRIVNVRKLQSKEDSIDKSDDQSAPSDDAVPPRLLSESDFSRIIRVFQEPVARWIGEFIRRGLLSDSVRWDDLAHVLTWMELSVDTRETMDLLAGWREANPGALPPTGPPARLARGRAVALQMPVQPEKALADLTDLLAWRAASEFVDPTAITKWKRPSEPDTLRKSARAYYRFQDVATTKRTEDRWSLDVRRIRDLLWIHRYFDEASP